MKRNSIEAIELDELIKRGNADICFESEFGLVVREHNEGIILSDILDGGQLLTMLEKLGLDHRSQYCVKGISAAETLREAYSRHKLVQCTAVVYCKSEPPEKPTSDITLLRQEDVVLAASHYRTIGESEEYIAQRLQAGMMWGLYEHGALAGFIGIHSEGSMGLLEVLPQYRRRGYGYQLESFLVRWHLERGWTPYAHIMSGNETSMRLQEKIGMTCAKTPSVWVF